MSEPNYYDRKVKLEKHIQWLISQPIREFEQQENVVIDELNVRYFMDMVMVKIKTTKK